MRTPNSFFPFVALALAIVPIQAATIIADFTYDIGATGTPTQSHSLVKTTDRT
jgi:hypothetical protein